jgi:hypothetical protein
MSWEELNPDTTSERMKSQELISLNLNITMTTHTSQPVKSEQDHGTFEQRIYNSKVNETIVGQEIVVKGLYVGSNKTEKHPNCSLRFITVNGGKDDWHIEKGDEHYNAFKKRVPRLIFMKFGYGMPLQTEIAETLDSDIPSFFGQMFPHVPAEKVILSMNGVTSRMLDLAKFEKSDRRWAHHNSDAKLWGDWCVWYNKEMHKKPHTALTEDEKKNALMMMVNSMDKSFKRRQEAKQVDPKQLFPYHYHSKCSRNYGFLVEGIQVCNILHVARAAAVYFYWPIGVKLRYSWTPDHLTEIKVTSPLFMKLFFTATSAPVGKNSPPNVGKVGGDGSNGSNSSMEGVDKAAAFDIDMDEIMYSASRPSVFDEEVYM